jgi:hypothetical protein
VEDATSVILVALWQRCVLSHISRPPHSLLILRSAAGCGKTVLSSTIIDEIKQQKLGVLAFFYFSFRRREGQDIQSLMYSLLIQLVSSLCREDPQHPNQYHLPRAFRDLYNKYQPARDPMIEDLNATFLGVLTESKDTYIVVDALDECPQKDRTEVVKFLAELSCDERSNTHILITSRREEDIENEISKISGEKRIVPMQNSQVNDDIRRHLENRMAEDFNFKKWSHELQKEVIKHLTENAYGVFRWVECQLVTLGPKWREKDVRLALKQLPKDLDATYHRMLSQIETDGYVDEAHAVLKWLACSNRPLKLSEVAEAAIFEPSLDPEDSLVSFDPKNRFPHLRDIRAILSGLVTISGIDDQSRLDDGEKDNADQNRVITFAHFSVKEYLVCDRVIPEFQLRETDDQWFILRSCLTYIHYYDTKASEVSGLERCPLLLYACKYWWHHAIALRCDKDQLTALLAELHGAALTLSIRVALGTKVDPPDKVLSSVLNNWLKDLDGKGLFTELTFDFESDRALHSASFMGEEALVKLMLDAGANVNWGDHDNRSEGYLATALHLAAKKGHEATVRLLLEYKADVNAKDNAERTALHLAAAEGHEAVVGLLLEHKADVDAKTKGKWTALHIAAGHGHGAVISLLLKNGADIEMKDFSGGTPLAAAIDNGSEAVIKLLLAKGAKVDCLYRLIESFLYYHHDHDCCRYPFPYDDHYFHSKLCVYPPDRDGDDHFYYYYFPNDLRRDVSETRPKLSRSLY